MTAVTKLRTQIEGLKQEGKIDGEAAIATVFEVIQDGDVDTEDYPALKATVIDVARGIADAVDIPRIPEFAERIIFEKLLLLALRSAYKYFRIPLPEDEA